jgi:hypothetical protein
MTPANGPRSGISEMQRAVGRIEGKMDAFIEQMKVQDERTTRMEAQHNERTTKLEGRIWKLEKWQWFYSGGGAVLGAILGAFGVHMRSG